MLFIKQCSRNLLFLAVFVVFISNLALAQATDNKEKYNQTLNQAEKLFFEKKYNEAKVAFQDAQKLMPGETHPKTRIGEINKILGIVDPVDGEYKQAIAKADALYKSNKFAEALDAYKTANDLLPDQQYTTDRIFELYALLKKNENLEKNYQSAITKGTQYYSEKKYELAITEFETALILKPGESVPTAKIAEIKKITATIADYQKAIEKADELYLNKEYEKAKTAYLQAQSVKPDEKYPQSMIGRIDETNAKLAGEEQARQQSYDQAVMAGDGFFRSREYSEARTSYESALKIKPSESYPKAKINEIENLLANIDVQEKQYAQFLVDGDKYYSEQKLSDALSAFQGAEKIKPDESYPKTKIAEISTLLVGIQQTEQNYQSAIAKADQEFTAKKYDLAKSAYENASSIKPEESYPKTKIAEIAALIEAIKKTEQNYQAAITKADHEFGAKNYELAKSEYQNASNFKPDESYPKARIAEISALLTGIQQTEQNYQAAIAKADQEFGAKNYDLAKADYQNASTIKPEESYPKTKIAEITTLLTGIQQTEQNYQSAIAKADQEFGAKNYELAKADYQNASTIKPEESYPKAKIAEIDALKAAEILAYEENRKNYNAFIASGNFQYDAENFHMARNSYNDALKLFPDEPYPKERLKDIDAILLAESERIQKEYNIAISEADRFFAGKVYDNAIEYYMQASGIKPDETYPIDRINAITKLIQENVVVDVLKQNTTIESGILKQYDFAPVMRQGRKESYVIIKMKNLSENDFRLFLNYGKGAAKNGGFVINIPKSENLRDYVIKVGGQYKWVSEDNNWISLQPEGGNAEISVIQISQE